MKRAKLYWDTLRHLRAGQLWYQIWRRLPPPKPDTGAPPPFYPAPGVWTPSAKRRPSLTGPTGMLFLGQPGSLDSHGWNDPAMPMLWRYNQHYFDDIAAAGAEERREWHQGLMARWITENEPGSRPGWDPYPTSLRLVNWSRWLLMGQAPIAGMLASMAVQTRMLAARLEKHLLGNHLLANAKALCFVGAMFAGKEADRWLKEGLRLLRRELPEQILADGGNFERSPMYHALCLEDLLDLVNLASAYPDRIPGADLRDWRKRAAGARFWLEAMCHPDGEIAQFNDAAIGIAPPVVELSAYAERLGVAALPNAGVERPAANLIWLRSSGYVRAEAGPAVLLCDVAPLGPDYLPAHGHADTLSFELSLGGSRIIVNGGTSRYGTCAIRQEERSTHSQSTVTIGGESSSEVWGGFRVARRAYPFDIFVHPTNRGAVIAASHNGYRRLPQSPVHRRTWTLAEDSLVIEDDVMPPASAEARFVLSPDLSVLREGDAGFRVDRATVTVASGDPDLQSGWHSRTFGGRRETEVIVSHLVEGRSVVKIDWQP